MELDTGLGERSEGQGPKQSMVTGRIWPATARWARASADGCSSEFRLLGDLKRVVNLDAEIRIVLSTLWT
jgi:hypothetical protein